MAGSLDPSVRIRGIGSFGSTAPLYVIDGVPEEKGGQIGYSDEEAEVQEAGDDLAFLDGEFVENETHDFI